MNPWISGNLYEKLTSLQLVLQNTGSILVCIAKHLLTFWNWMEVDTTPSLISSCKESWTTRTLDCHNPVRTPEAHILRAFHYAQKGAHLSDIFLPCTINSHYSHNRTSRSHCTSSFVYNCDIPAKCRGSEPRSPNWCYRKPNSSLRRFSAWSF